MFVSFCLVTFLVYSKEIILLIFVAVVFLKLNVRVTHNHHHENDSRTINIVHKHKEQNEDNAQLSSLDEENKAEFKQFIYLKQRTYCIWNKKFSKYKQFSRKPQALLSPTSFLNSCIFFQENCIFILYIKSTFAYINCHGVLNRSEYQKSRPVM